MKQKKVRRIVSGALAVAMVLSSITVSPAITAKAATTVELKEGTKYTIVSRKSGKALAVENDSKSNNAKIVQKALDSSDSQIWTLDYDNNGYYQIVNENSGKVLDVPNSSKKEGEQIIQWNKGNGNNQKWKITESGNGYYRISPKITSKYGLNVSKNSTNDNAKIQQWTYHGDANEQWEIREVNKKKELTGTVFLTFEAEDGYIKGGPIIKEVPDASGGKLLTYLRGSSDAEYVFRHGGDAGEYTFRIYYASDEDRDMCVFVYDNGEVIPYPVHCPSTGGWEKVGEPVEVQVGLLSYSSRIWIGSLEGYAPNVDYFQLVIK